MALDFADLKQAFADRGFDYLSPTRQGHYVNWAMHELNGLERWPYLEASVTGAAPLAIVDLGTVEHVLNMEVIAEIIPAQYGELVQMFGDLSATGPPVYYYLAWPGDVPTVATYPESDSTIGVQYWRFTGDMTADGDEPAVPDRFRKIIVDMAVREAYRDFDDPQAAEGVQVQIDRDVARMRDELLTQQLQGPSFIRILNGSADW